MRERERERVREKQKDRKRERVHPPSVSSCIKCQLEVASLCSRGAFTMSHINTATLKAHKATRILTNG